MVCHAENNSKCDISIKNLLFFKIGFIHSIIYLNIIINITINVCAENCICIRKNSCKLQFLYFCIINFLCDIATDNTILVDNIG